MTLGHLGIETPSPDILMTHLGHISRSLSAILERYAMPAIRKRETRQTAGIEPNLIGPVSSPRQTLMVILEEQQDVKMRTSQARI
jgi:hypothetical protein